MLAAGSGEILRAVTLAFTGPGKALVSAVADVRVARAHGAGRPRRRCARFPWRLTARSISRRMAAASTGAGLAFVCNPNNPTGGINPESAVTAFVKEFRAASPDGYVLVDEAYCDYVTDTSYASAIPLTMTDPRVLVSRTFSKIHGMAGRTRRLRRRPPRRARAPFAPRRARARCRASAPPRRSRRSRIRSTSIRQRTLNRDARAFTRKAFENRRLQGAAVGGQLRHGRRQARVLGLPAALPRGRGRDRAAVSAADDLRADHDRHDGRDEEGACR